MVHIYTTKQLQFIRDNAKGIGNAELTKIFNLEFHTNLKVSQIKSFKHNHKISSGLTGHFPKGNVPSNKGKTWDEYMSKECQKKSRKTCFKKGNKPSNTYSLGTERHRTDGYIDVKVANSKEPGMSRKTWKLKHHLLWEEHYGPVPVGHKVIFTNGDKKDFRIENLALVTHNELLVMNRQGLIYENEELTQVGIGIAKLIAGVNKKMKMEE